jgi:hypothetical protein
LAVKALAVERVARRVADESFMVWVWWCWVGEEGLLTA